MKILKVILRNLHSLKGNHTIDFANGILANAGLYAITGQTGAGKSTILDAITLALYGQSNRHGNAKAEEEIITRNEKEAFAETTFEVNHEVYVARWAASYTKNRTLKATERRLYQYHDGELLLLTEGVSATQNAVLTIIGLNFDQFTKSVLLAQNNFSAFLKAKPSERAEMLSKITGTQIYEDISKAVFEKTSVLKDELLQLTVQLKSDLLDDEAVEVLQKLVLDKTAALEILKAENLVLLDKINVINDSRVLQADLAQFQASIQLIETQMVENEAQYLLLAQYQKALLLQQVLSDYENSQKNIALNQTQLDEVTLVLEEVRLTLGQLETHIQTNTAALHAFQQNLDESLPLIEEAKKIKSTYDHKFETLQELNNEIASKAIVAHELSIQIVSLDKATVGVHQELYEVNLVIDQNRDYQTWETQRNVLGNHYTDITSMQKAISGMDTKGIQAHIAQLTTQQIAIQQQQQTLMTHIGMEEETIGNLSSQLHHLPVFELLTQEKEQLQGQLNLLTKYDEYLTKIATAFHHQNGLKTIEQELKSALSAATIALEQQVMLVDVLNENAILQQKIAGFAQHRADLEKGKPCPLCGADHHPFAENNPPQDEQKERWKAEQTKLTEDRHRCAGLEKEYASVLADLRNSNATLIDLNSEVVSVKSLIVIEIHDNDLPTAISSTQLQLDKVQKQLAEHQLLTARLLAQNKVLKTHSDAYNDLNVKALLLQNEVDVQTQVLENQRAIVKDKWAAIQAAYDNIRLIFKEFGEVLKDDDIELVKVIAKQLTANFQQWLKATQDSEAIKARLMVMQTAMVESLSQKGSVEDLLTSLKMKQLQVVTEKDSLAEELTKIVSQFTLSDPVQEEERLRNMLKNCQQALHQDTNQQAALSAFMLEKSNVQQKMLLDQGVLTLSFQSATVMLNAAMEENAFGSISELKLALSLSNHAQIKQQQDAEAQQYQQLKGALHAAQLKLETLMLKGLPEEDLYGLMLAQNELENTQTVYYQEIGSVNEQLRKNEIEILQNQQKIAVIKNKESVFHQWQQLNGLIGSKSGDSFKKFAQDFTLTLLIQHANRHLKVMYNRYELYKKDDSTEMELQIKDKNFFDDVRNINSLSGGETFLVSLSLALGLSDLASKKTKIRSLFIDEGFGTLDPENLNNALDALELLRQTDDRQIGIISHVEELKKRIHTQIQVNKVTAEFSEIMIVD